MKKNIQVNQIIWKFRLIHNTSLNFPSETTNFPWGELSARNRIKIEFSLSRSFPLAPLFATPCRDRSPTQSPLSHLVLIFLNVFYSCADFRSDYYCCVTAPGGSLHRKRKWKPPRSPSLLSKRVASFCSYIVPGWEEVERRIKGLMRRQLCVESISRVNFPIIESILA